MADVNPAAPLALIVEDHADTRHLAAVLLEESDFSVIECDSAEAAVSVMPSLVAKEALVFIDIRLPGMIDGVDLARAVRTHWPHVELIVTSGYPGDRPAGLPDGATYLEKPWRALDILMAAERALPRHAAA